MLKKLKRSLPSKFESKISDVKKLIIWMRWLLMSLLEFFKPLRSYGEKENKKEDPHEIAFKVTSSEDPLVMLS